MIKKSELGKRRRRIFEREKGKEEGERDKTVRWDEWIGKTRNAHEILVEVQKVWKTEAKMEWYLMHYCWVEQVRCTEATDGCIVQPWIIVSDYVESVERELLREKPEPRYQWPISHGLH